MTSSHLKVASSALSPSAVSRIPLTAVDLFAGAGGLSLGFVRAGFRVVWACDHDEAAVETYRLNLGDHANLTDLSGPVQLPAATIVCGGPPCQGFSSAGLRRADDGRNELVRRFADLVLEARPLAFVFENVEGFLTMGAGSAVLDLLEPLIGAGYRVHVRKVNAANFGVAQHRKRVLVIGGRGWSPRFPQPTHEAYGAPGARLVGRGLPATPTLADALAGLPTPPESAPGSPPDHYATQLRGVDLERATALLPGQTMRDLPEVLWHASYRRRANRRVRDGMASERRGGAPAGIRRLRGDEPCKAITGGARNEFLHPKEHRPLTIRECARVQTFPDSFLFSGTPSQRVQLIGNAVPPKLAEATARSLAGDLATAKPDQLEGELLSFVPTWSGGMSPALAKVVGVVTRRFSADEELEQASLWA